MNAEIITIGDEILIGQITDTNSQWIATELNKIGVDVYQITSIQDKKSHILKALTEAMYNSNIIILTGGLGPTKDDVTKQTICEFFDDKLVLNKEVLAHVEELFAKYIKKTPISDLNRNQALVPEKATVLFNEYGTAPGMLFQKNGKIVVSLPGVPYEMKHLISSEVIPVIREKFELPYILHKTLLTIGVGESSIATRIEDWEAKLPYNIKLAYLPSLGSVRLRLSARGLDKEKLTTELNTLVNELIEQVKDIFIGFDEEASLQSSVGKLLTGQNKTLAIAESCTGGAISSLLTSVPGASKYFVGSVVSYHERIKKNLLNVSESSVKKHSVVSEVVAKEMALGIQKLYNTDFAIGVTGNAGPTKDKTDEEVGKVFIAIACAEKVEVQSFNFGQPRYRVIEKAKTKALELLKEIVVKNSL